MDDGLGFHGGCLCDLINELASFFELPIIGKSSELFCSTHCDLIIL